MKWLFTLLLIINLTIYFVWIRGEDPLWAQPQAEIEAPEDMGQIRLLSETEPLAADQTAEQDSQELVAEEMEAEATEVETTAETKEPEGTLPKAEPQEEAADTATVEESTEETQAHPFGAESEASLVETVARCGSMGGLKDENGTNEALSEMEGEGVEVSVESVKEQIHIGYWVLIPPMASAQEAQQKLEELRGQGIVDIWHIRGGEANNAISLGMFSREENAQKYREKMAAQGVTAELRPRYINKKGYRINFQISGKPAVVEEYWNSLELRYPGLKLTESTCNEIATGE
jgi:hypothetical protein